MKKNYLNFVLFCVGLFLSFSVVVAQEQLNIEKTDEAVIKNLTLEEVSKTEEVLVPGYANPYKWNNGLKGEAAEFSELWGYVLPDYLPEDSNLYNENSPLTDIGLFAAEVDTFGNVINIPNRDVVKDFPGRVHLVAVCNSISLSHFVLSTGSIRRNIAKTLASAAKEFDGVQIDFELIPAQDAKYYLSFLKYLKGKLKGKPLTVCVHARTKTLAEDAEDYAAIGAVVDKIMIMAYDEHWGTSAPGSIASMDWCKKIADYALTIWSADKYIMGLPFYGRTWPNMDWRKAWYFEGENRIMHENNVIMIERENDIPHFSFKTEVTVTGWYEDAHSLTVRARMYKDLGYTNLAFWRIGQEDVAVWQWIKSAE